MSPPISTYHKKLVRDRVPQRIEANGERCETRELENRTHFLYALADKLTEETNEAATALNRLNLLAGHPAHDQNQLNISVLEEFADITAIVDEILYAIGRNSLDLNAVKCAKLRTHGGFQTRTFLERTWREEK